MDVCVRYNIIQQEEMITYTLIFFCFKLIFIHKFKVQLIFMLIYPNINYFIFNSLNMQVILFSIIVEPNIY